MAAALVLGACHGGKGDGPVTPAQAQDRYFPDGLGELYLGLPLENFRAMRGGGETGGSDAITFRIELKEDAPTPELAFVVYYFDVDIPGQPLYELIMGYPEGTNVAAIARDALGPPNSGTEWRFVEDASFPIRVWIFQQKIVVAAEMEGTEWDPNQ